MAGSSSAADRLGKVKDFLTWNKTVKAIPWDPDSTAFPTRHNLPKIPGAPDQAAWVWGEDDFVGRINLLTPARVAAASKEIRSGEIVPTNLPLNVPYPGFGREAFQHKIKTLAEGVAYDDIYQLNTQHSTQLDGLRHHAHPETKTFYNHTKAEDIIGPAANLKCSVHYWAEHGIAGRGILLDFRRYANKHGIVYDPHEHFEITYEHLAQCGKEQGIDIRPQAQGGDIKIGDILFVRGGWTEAYWEKTDEQRKALGARAHKFGPDDPTRFAGIVQDEKVLDWIHDCYFSLVAGDSPTFEAWPSRRGFYLHGYLLALWGIPIGEMLDLEKLAVKCHERRRWTFFFTSAPANCPHGVSSHVNGTAIL